MKFLKKIVQSLKGLKLADKFFILTSMISAMLFTNTAFAAEGDVLPSAADLKTLLDSLGVGALLGAIVLFMLGIAVAIWGGRKVVAFFSGK